MPQHHGVAQQVRNDVDDAAVGHDVPHATAVLVPVDHLVVAPPGRQRPGQQVVDVGPDLGDLAAREDVDGEQMARLVVPADLLDAERPRLVDPQRDEPKVTIEFRKCVGVCVMSAVRRLRAPPQTSRHQRLQCRY